MVDAVEAIDERVVWVQQDREMWTARRGGRPVGTVEHGHRYTAIGVDGVARSGYRTLRSAQEALERGEGASAADPVPARIGAVLLLAGTVAGAVALWTAVQLLVD